MIAYLISVMVYLLNGVYKFKELNLVFLYFIKIAFFQSAGQRVIGEPIVSGLVLNDSWLWDPDFVTAAK